jgi:hypothetical protein
MTKLKPYDTVIYRGPIWPEENLRPGDVGVVLEDYGDGNYEVQLDDPDWTAKVIFSFPGSQLQKKPPH